MEKESKKSNLFSNFIIVTIGIIGFFVLSNQILKDKKFSSFDNYITKTNIIDITTPNGIIKVEVASTTSSLEMGLSNRAILDQDQGMLFVFDKEDRHGFWMKDMNFALDIIWLDKNKKVISIQKALTPQTYPAVYYPISPSKYVLEINAFASDNYQIATGTTLTFQQ